MGSVTESSNSLELLAQNIEANSKLLSEYLVSSGLPQPSFDADGPPIILPASAAKEAHLARAALAEAAFKLFQLVTGPSELIPNMTANYQTIFALRWLCHFNIFALVPLRGSVPYSEVAIKAMVPERQLKAVARMAMTSNILAEPQSNQLGHSAASAMFAINSSMIDWANFMFDASIPTASKMVEATEKWPDSVQKNETAYNIAFGHDLPFFDHVSQNPRLSKQFSGYMRSVTDSQGTDLTHLVDGFDWSSLPKDALVVDVGGSTGHATFALAKAYHHLRFEVQDLEPVAKNGTASLISQPGQISSRVSFRAHDFFQPQPVQGGRVYLLRMILHDWPEKEAVSILLNLVPALAKDSTILLMDTVMPAPGQIPATKERLLRVRDLTMRQVFNSQERTLDDWEGLLKLADARLRLRNVYQPYGSNMSLMSVSLEA